MAKDFQRIDVFSLFNALYEKGETKLSDHVIKEDSDESNGEK